MPSRQNNIYNSHEAENNRALGKNKLKDNTASVCVQRLFSNLKFLPLFKKFWVGERDAIDAGESLRLRISFPIRARRLGYRHRLQKQIRLEF